MAYIHEPVLLSEIIAYSNPQTGNTFIDCTLGGGGYTFKLAEMVGEKGLVLAIDADELAIKNAEEIIKNKKIKNIILAHANFKDLTNIKKEKMPENRNVDGIVFDLGLSSAQLEDRSRGFSFSVDAPLDMSFGGVETRHGASLQQIHDSATFNIINKYKKEDLIKILREYGEERFAGRIVGAILNERRSAPIKTTGELVNVIKKAVPQSYLRQKIHFATRTFQALRIASNDELNSLRKVLPQALDILKPEGRIAVVSFHSLEDRIVKHYFKDESRDCICPPKLPICACGHKAKLKILTKKAVLPSEKETKKNPRARSAKLRVIEKI